PLPVSPRAGPAGGGRSRRAGMEAALGRRPAARPRTLPPLPEDLVSKLTSSPAWQALAAHQRKHAQSTLRELFASNPARAERFSLEFGDILLDFSKQRVDSEAMRLLAKLAAQAQVPAWITRMFAGEAINNTEGRAALHVALRSDSADFPQGGNVMPAVHAA